MKKLFQDLIWPAAAGNVAWSFFTVAIGEDWSCRSVGARLIVLSLLALYLALDWLYIGSADGQRKRDYWIADGILVAAIVVFAIAAQLEKTWLEIALAVVFGVAIGGHLLGAWESGWRARGKLALINALGPTIIFGSHLVFKQPYPWNLPTSLALVLTVWIYVRRHTFCRSAEPT